MPITIVLADDHPLLLNGTKEYLIKKSYKVIATATTGTDAYNQIIKLKPEIAVLDFDIPKMNGLEIAKAVKRNHLHTKIIILSLHKHESILREIEKNIDAYITKDSAMEELHTCIQTVYKGEIFIGSKLKNTIQFDVRETAIHSLTATELKILKNLNKNLNSAQIAELLFVSKRTVEKHRSNIIKKLGLDSSNQNALLLWLKNHPELFNS